MRRILFSCAIATITALAPALALGGERQDKAAAEQIAAVLRDSGKMQDYAVGVKYKDGTVWLSGRVTSQQQMQNALQVVSDIEGVEQIVNSLTVTQAAGTTLKQPLGTPSPAVASSRASARRVSATSADFAGGDGQRLEMQQQAAPADGEVPAGFHRLAARHANMARPIPTYAPGTGGAVAPAAYDQPHLPNYAWPSYAAYPNYAALTYPKQYSPTAFPFIGPFYPYPQVPLGWRKVSLEWDDGWWFLDFHDRSSH
ncbi:MAG: BON domain-containing protein [Planctomycetia bacterium]|nr:BON domain-containing protein [Planctomycetia bacterium]